MLQRSMSFRHFPEVLQRQNLKMNSKKLIMKNLNECHCVSSSDGTKTFVLIAKKRKTLQYHAGPLGGMTSYTQAKQHEHHRL